MSAMTKDQKVQIGAEIRRVREAKPRISRQAIADASDATLSENTVLAVERGEAIESSIDRVITALAKLGRPVEIVPADLPEDASAGPGGGAPDASQLVGDLVAAVLRAAPPEVREELRQNVWLLVRGQNEQLIERLQRSTTG